MPKIKVEIEVGNEFCDKCPMFQLYPRLRDTHCNRGAFCSLYDIPLTFSSRNLAYVRCDECKQAEVKDKSMGKDYCVHPGNIMRAVLMSINKSQKWLAKEMNVNKTVVSSLLAGKRGVTTMVAAAFERATGYPAESLLHQQKKYELFQLGGECDECKQAEVKDE